MTKKPEHLMMLSSLQIPTEKGSPFYQPGQNDNTNILSLLTSISFKIKNQVEKQ
ncbi:MAG: hypothetical protein IPM91_15895 [Bacteroidetes bacterium]|nr:hypothetical protein [Bacteroidota bacterium]